MAKVVQLLKSKFPQLEFKSHHELAPQTYFKIAGPVEVYVESSDLNQLTQLYGFCHQERIPVTLLGGASNVLITDTGIAGLVIKNTNQNITHQSQRPNQLTVGAGLQTARLVRASIDHGLTGLEPFLGVPGVVGGAVVNNAHYLERLIGEFVSRVEVATTSGQRVWLDQAECEFEYDHSRFHSSQELILKVEFVLTSGNSAQSQQTLVKAVKHRATTQPLGLPSSGCIFRNPSNTKQLRAQFPQFADREHIPAGFLIDQAGLKGLSQGDAQISEVHAAFIVNHGRATSQDVQTLINQIKTTVYERFSVHLQEEIFHLGNSES